jgi:hypothetical protein
MEANASILPIMPNISKGEKEFKQIWGNRALTDIGELLPKRIL